MAKPDQAAGGPGSSAPARPSRRRVPRFAELPGWLRYLLAGGSSFVLNVILLNIFKEGLGWSIETSALLAFWGTFGYSYLVQRGAVFRSGTGWVRSVVLYGLLVLFNSAAITVVVSACHRAGLGLATSQFIGTAMVTCWNYFAYKYVLFPQRPARAGDQGVVDEP